MRTKKMSYEYLRIVAILFVIFNHTDVKGYLYFTQTNNLFLQIISMILSILCKTAVPLFFMISGALLLSKQDSIGELYKKRVIKYILIIFLFSLLIYFYDNMDGYLSGQFSFSFLFFMKTVITSEVTGSYWFLYTYVALLIMLPFLQNMVYNLPNKYFVYLIVLYIWFRAIIPSMLFPIGDHTLAANMYIPLIGNSIFYFIIGYYFANIVPQVVSDKQKLSILFFLSSICFVITIVMTYLTGYFMGTLNDRFFEAFLLFPTFSIFVLAELWEKKRNFIRNRRIVEYVGSLCFGIYLIEHIVRTSTLNWYQYCARFMNSLLASCIWTISTFLICVMIVSTAKCVLHKPIDIFYNIYGIIESYKKNKDRR